MKVLKFFSHRNLNILDIPTMINARPRVTLESSYYKATMSQPCDFYRRVYHSYIRMIYGTLLYPQFMVMEYFEIEFQSRVLFISSVDPTCM
jgi:hypothetical protein